MLAANIVYSSWTSFDIVNKVKVSSFFLKNSYILYPLILIWKMLFSTS